jgi:CRP-like cAMP-binding protein
VDWNKGKVSKCQFFKVTRLPGTVTQGRDDYHTEMVEWLVELMVRGVAVLNPFLHASSSEDAVSPFQAADELMRTLIPVGQKQKVEPGNRVFSFGEAAKGVYVIVNGTARASLPGEQGSELVCRTAGPGSVLGLPSALCAAPYQFDVEALEPVDVIFLQTDSVNEILRQRPELCMQVMTMMCEELNALRQTREHMQSCGKQSCSLHERCTRTCTLQ